MVFRVLLAREFNKAFEAVGDGKVERQIEKKLLELKDHPERFKPLRYSLKGYRSIRVGGLRILFRIEGKTVYVLSLVKDHGYPR